MTLVKTEPEHRIAYKILTNALFLHQMNSTQRDPIKFSFDEINKINSKYNDL